MGRWRWNGRLRGGAGCTWGWITPPDCWPKRAARWKLRRPAPGLEIRFAQADLAAPGWSAELAGQVFDGCVCFAVLHHIPSEELRLALLREAGALLPSGGRLIHSVWQFQHSPRLLERVLPWEAVGLQAEELDEGDTLLDWRAADAGCPGQAGLRYVHRFSLAELEALAAQSGFGIHRDV